ncbi:MAG: hypothetical protein GY758_14060, partial [Fuerstiella sp.]|nr:hypothetical protein [Fuerstiella sp.]
LMTPKSDQGNPYGSPATDTKPEMVCGSHHLKHMIWKISILTAATGSLATLYYIRAMTEHSGPPVAAAVLLSFLTGPYAALALLTW